VNRPDLLPWLGREITVVIDRPAGSKHETHDLRYPINYGFVPNTVSGDGEPVDVYVLGTGAPLEVCFAKVVAVVVRSNDVEDKLVAAVAGTWSAEAVTEAIAFQERFFDSRVHVR
jgi:inorganic pyrophosphatase